VQEINRKAEVQSATDYFEYDQTLRRTINASDGAKDKFKSDSRPALVASLFSESSASPWDRTCPLRTNEVEVGRARPLASTSAMLSWIEA